MLQMILIYGSIALHVILNLNLKDILLSASESLLNESDQIQDLKEAITLEMETSQKS